MREGFEMMATFEMVWMVWGFVAVVFVSSIIHLAIESLPVLVAERKASGEGSLADDTAQGTDHVAAIYLPLEATAISSGLCGYTLA